MIKSIRSLLIAGALGVGMLGAGCSNPTSSSERTDVARQAGVFAGAVTTDNTTYSADQTINVSWTGMPAGATDWVGLARFGAPPDSIVSFAYTGGTVDGTHGFAGPAGGDYELRYYTNDSFNVFATSPKITVDNPATLTTSPSYPALSPISITFGGLPGNAKDWIALAAPGSAATSFVTFKYTDGAKSGVIDLDGVSAGNYVARSFENSSYTLLKESAPFTVGVVGGPSVTTNPSYVAYGPVTVSFSGLPGNKTDWIAITTVGAAPETIMTWQYTNGAQSGTLDIAGVAAGNNYVARAFENDTYTVLAESAAFSVTPGAATSVTTNKGAYAPAESAILAYSGMPGNAYDWVAIATPGSDLHSFIAWQYTGGGATGSKSFSLAGLDGAYVARAFVDNSYTLLNESPEFTVGTVSPLTTDANTYTAGSPITITFKGLPGNANDWIAISPVGSSDETFTSWKYTYAAVDGSVVLTAPAGTYQARAYENNGYNVLFRSATFTVTAPVAGAATVSIGAGTYTDADTILVNYSGMSGAATDWISIAVQGSADTEIVAWVYTNGLASGTASFSAAGRVGGPYVARAYFNDSFVKEAESTASFTVTPAGP